MGVFSDLLSTSSSLDKTVPITALDRSVVRELNEWVNQGDVDYVSKTVATNEAQFLQRYAVDFTGGTFTLAFTLKSGETFTTAGVAFDANAATVETAVDVAATAASVVGWTNGDIAVTGTTIQVGGTGLTFTYSGDSVSNQKQPLLAIDGAGLTGGGSLRTPNQLTTVHGQTKRPAWGALAAIGIVTLGDIPLVQGSNAGPASQNYRNHANGPSEAVIRALAAQAAITDENASIEDAIVIAAGLPVRPR